MMQTVIRPAAPDFVLQPARAREMALCDPVWRRRIIRPELSTVGPTTYDLRRDVLWASRRGSGIPRGRALRKFVKRGEGLAIFWGLADLMALQWRDVRVFLALLERGQTLIALKSMAHGPGGKDDGLWAPHLFLVNGGSVEVLTRAWRPIPQGEWPGDYPMPRFTPRVMRATAA